MFFQTIYQMMTPGTDLSIHIRKVEDKLSVAVMPRRNSLKEEVQQKMVPLVLSGNPYELDSAFLQAIMQPLQKVQGLLVNAENFEKQAAQAAASGKTARAVRLRKARKPVKSGKRWRNCWPRLTMPSRTPDTRKRLPGSGRPGHWLPVRSRAKSTAG